MKKLIRAVRAHYGVGISAELAVIELQSLIRKTPLNWDDLQIALAARISVALGGIDIMKEFGNREKTNGI